MIISGVGRAGTMFLVRYVTLLGFETEFTLARLESNIDPIAQAGLEH